MPTFLEQQQRTYRVRHKLAVWQHLYNYIDETYVPKDHTPPEKAIREPNAIPDIVPEEIYDDVLEHIGFKVSELKGELKELENQEVVVLDKNSDEVPHGDK